MRHEGEQEGRSTSTSTNRFFGWKVQVGIAGT